MINSIHVFIGYIITIDLLIIDLLIYRNRAANVQ